MELYDQLRALGERITKQVDRIATEEAAKTAFVMPFIQALGYNLFDPSEVVPEFTADVGTKKGEKVDYAIMLGGEPVILMECKWDGPELDDKHMSQLYRYFSVTKARIGVLTNGVVYRFFSDLEEKNKMDARPFLVLDMRDVNEQLVAELKRLTKESFDLDSMLSAAGGLKHMREIRTTLTQEMNEPSEEFIRFFFARVAPGRRLTEGARGQFADLVKKAFGQFIKEHVDRRLESALSAGGTGRHAAVPVQEAPGLSEGIPGEDDEVKIETTQEELEGFFIVKSILRGAISSQRIVQRDGKGYFSVLLDDNNRKPLCRLRFNSKKKSIGLFDEGKEERRIPIVRLDDIYTYAPQLRATLARYQAAGDQADTEAEPAPSSVVHLQR